MHFRYGAVRVRENTHHASLSRRLALSHLGLNRMWINGHRVFWYLFVQQHFRGPKRWVSQESALHRFVKQYVRQRQQAHTSMMPHVLPNGDTVDIGRQA